jgi:hypothetical protein
MHAGAAVQGLCLVLLLAVAMYWLGQRRTNDTVCSKSVGSAATYERLQTTCSDTETGDRQGLLKLLNSVP